MSTYGAVPDDVIERAIVSDARANEGTSSATRRARVGAGIFALLMVLGGALVLGRATFGSGAGTMMPTIAVKTPALGANAVQEALNEALDHLPCVQTCARLKDALSRKIEGHNAAMTCDDFKHFANADSCVSKHCHCEDATVIDETVKYLCDEGGDPNSVGKDAFHTRTEDAVIAACAPSGKPSDA
ncbi:unnamed product [Ostreococcus tauri]|uniref:Unnamed product n=1 Tax=Ostreococcus tauri TaxID=70448 RepID=A0A090N3A8_OSTTA|nr:unnamed product [Ostreococcus tauri]CEF97793.1 unnamed product [Ostreococcus tauri]|eukprot:XP_003079093.2 unnamed product [Ostreococcus tauri]